VPDDRRAKTGPDPESGSGSGPESGVDRELDLRGIVLTGIGLAILLVVTMALMWPLATGMRSVAARGDGPQPMLPEALRQPLPPEPRLQIDPERELEAMRHEEARRLESYAWVNEPAGVARVPVERAIEILLAQEAAR